MNKNVMKYLFFDIECSNCFKSVGKICEFGYVIVDEKMNIVQKNVITINPGKGRENRFYLTGRKKQKDIVLAFDEEDYYASPEFPIFYDTIKNLIVSNDTLVFGYSVSNDIKYIHSTLERYKLEQLNYDAFDVQVIVKNYYGQENKISGLKNAMINLGLGSELVKLDCHLSRDDAIMSMLVVKQICYNLNLKLPELLELYKNCKVNSLKCVAEQLDNAKMRELAKKRSDESKKNMEKWKNFCEEFNQIVHNNEEQNTFVCVSFEVMKVDCMIEKLINAIKSKNIYPTMHLDDSDIMIVVDESDKLRLMKSFKRPYCGEFIYFEKFIV